MKRTILYLGWMMILAIIITISSCCKEETNSNQLPVCIITSPSEGQEIAKGETVIISVEANDNDGSVAEVRFFINGVGQSSINSFPYNFDWNTSNESIGDNTIKATCVDNIGGITSDEIIVVITDGGGGGGEEAPNSNFTANPTSGSAPLLVSFTDHSTNDPTTWQWDFGDGNSSTQQNTTHTYNINGFYSVTLTVTNEYGTDTQTKTNLINVSSGGGSGEPCPGTPTVTDIDGNVYNTVLLGTQCWMKENLRVGTYISGLQNMEDNGTIEKYCQNDDLANCDIFGGLYQWDEMMQYSTQPGVQGICPIGWHLPTDEEWKQMEMHLGMSQSATDSTDFRGTDQGKQLKSTSGWFENGNGTNSSGFFAFPGGFRFAQGGFGQLGIGTYWWTSTEFSDLFAWYRGVVYFNNGVRRDTDYEGTGQSVRCVKN